MRKYVLITLNMIEYAGTYLNKKKVLNMLCNYFFRLSKRAGETSPLPLSCLPVGVTVTGLEPTPTYFINEHSTI